MPARHVLLATAAAGLLLLAACGGTASTAYPTVIVPAAKHLPPITDPNGGVAELPVPPRVYSTQPSASCEWVKYSSDSNAPAAPATLSPPAPGLKAVALSARTIRITYSFSALPSDCRPSFVTLGIVAGRSARATPNVKQFPLHGLSGTQTLSYPSFLPRPDVALGSADMSTGVRSRVVKVLIRR